MTQLLLQKRPSPLANQAITPGHSTPTPQHAMLSTVLEGFADGILMLTVTGDCIHSNQRAQKICRQLCQTEAEGLPSTPFKVPKSLWAICECLIESRSLFPGQPLVLTKTLTDARGRAIRVRVQWLVLHGSDETCLLMMLEDQTYTAQLAALLESRQFNLTDRETQVWILRKADYSYDAIASKLFITTNTVKRHLKSIYAKRKQVLAEVEDLTGVESN